MIDLNHKHLILKGIMTEVLTINKVKNVIDDLVDNLDMKYVKSMPVNPMVAYEPVGINNLRLFSRLIWS